MGFKLTTDLTDKDSKVIAIGLGTRPSIFVPGRTMWQARTEGDPMRQRTQTASFRLTRYFTITSLIAFSVVAFVVTYFMRQQMDVFQQIQAQQHTLVTQAQDDFSS